MSSTTKYLEDMDPAEVVTCRRKDGTTFQATRGLQLRVWDAIERAETERRQREAAGQAHNT